MIEKKITPILQDEVSECGLACIAMVMSCFPNSVSLNELRKRYQVSKDGMSLYQVIRVLGEFGVDSTPLSGSSTELKDLNMPAILLWNRCHYVLLEKTDGKEFTIIDPALGRRRYSAKEVSMYFSGVALEVAPNPLLKINKYKKESTKKEKTPFSFKSIFLSSPWVAKNIIFAFILMMGIQIFSLASPKLFSLTIDEVVSKNDEELLYLIVYVFSLVFLFLSALRFIRNRLDMVIRRVIEQDLSNSFIHYVSHLSLAFFQKRSSAGILRKFHALDMVYLKFTAGWVDILSNAIFCLVFLVLMGMLNAKLTLISSILFVAFLSYRLFIVVKIEHSQKRLIAKEIERDQSLISMVDEVKVSKLYGNTSVKAAQWSAFQSESVDIRANIEYMQKNNTAMFACISNAQSLIISALGALAILKGDNSIGDIFSFYIYKDLFLNSALRIIDQYAMLKIVKVDMDRLDDFLDEEPEKIAGSHGSASTERVNHIHISHVTYRYGSFEDNVIDDVCLDIAYGDHVALCGKSGGGKSTFLNILSSLYAPTSGDVQVNNKALDAFGLQKYRDKVAYVGSEDGMVAGTVAENITMHSSYSCDDFVKECAQEAGIYDEVMRLPADFNTLVGKNGIDLSSGQKQRILIARALYRKPDFMILDEPTSHLDDRSKHIILEKLRSLPCAMILVTHDELSRSYMEKTIRLIDGKLVD